MRSSVTAAAFALVLSACAHRAHEVIHASARADADTDKDGIADVDDRCPNEPEDRDGFEDEDGCPDPDNDQDGIVDSDDHCPNMSETFNGYEDEDGCPDRPRVPIRMCILPVVEKIFFTAGNAQVKSIAAPILKALAAEINSRPYVRLIEVQGHRDDGRDARTPAIGEARARAVLDALVSLGVDRRRLVVRDYGTTRGLCSARTESCRMMNRYVVLEQLDPPPQDERGPMTFGEVASLRAKLETADRLSEKGDLGGAIHTLRDAVRQIGARYWSGAVVDDTGTKLLLADEKEAQKEYGPAFHLFRDVLESRLALSESTLPRSFSLWTHGGEPGSMSRELLVKRKNDGTFTALVHEAGGERSSRKMKRIFEAELPKADAEAFVDLVIMSPVFAPRSADGDRSNQVADGLIEDWALISSARTVTARYTEPFAENLMSIRAACQRLTQQIENVGRKK